MSCGQQFSLRASLVLTSTSAARYVMNMSDEMLDLISLQPDYRYNFTLHSERECVTLCFCFVRKGQKYRKQNWELNSKQETSSQT